MSDDGYGLDKIEDEEKTETKSRSIITKKDKVRYSSLDPIISSRNKIHYEVNMLGLEKKERIGRLNMALFGSADRKTFISKLQKLQDELKDPMTMDHPIVYKVNDVINLVQQLQIEYRDLFRLYEKNIDLMDWLLYDAIHQKRNIENITSTNVTPSEIPGKLVSQFMINTGSELVKLYSLAVTNNEYDKAGEIKEKFIAAGIAFFTNHHPDPKFVAEKVFIHFITHEKSN